MSAPLTRRKRLTALFLTLLTAGMVGLSFAAVPLYRIFCQATGFEGTTQRAKAAPGEVAGRELTVRFNADTDPALPWRFVPLQSAVKVHAGEQAMAYFRATNLSKEPVVGQAVFNVTPLKTGLYFDKVQCFCFSKQKLAPGESADMPVVFFVDPDMLKDRNMDDVDTITLSYTFYRDKEAEGGDKAAARGEAPAAPQRVN